eukprot:Platyproteum_vivax@DN17167_c0_g1_i1.p1
MVCTWYSMTSKPSFQLKFPEATEAMEKDGLVDLKDYRRHCTPWARDTDIEPYYHHMKAVSFQNDQVQMPLVLLTETGNLYYRLKFIIMAVKAESKIPEWREAQVEDARVQGMIQ